MSSKLRRRSAPAAHVQQKSSRIRPASDAFVPDVARLIEQDRKEQSLELLKQTLARDPQHPGAHCELASLSLLMGDYRQADALLTEADRLGGSAIKPRVATVRGDMFYRLQRLADAEAAYQVALAANPRHAPDAVRSRALLGLGQIDLSRHQAAAALGRLREAARLDPHSHSIQYALARALDKTGDRVGAMAAFQAAIKIKADDPAVLNDMGQLLSNLGKLDEAAGAFGIAARLRPDLPVSSTNLGLTLYQLGRYKEAAEAFSASLACDPGNAVARHMLAAMRGDHTPDRASDAYVKTTFDNFAPEFEAKLAGLRYRAPELLGQVIAEHVGTPGAELSILDAGCGTGLCGPLLRPYARSLVGVDLSAGMLEKAEARGIYDQLLACEITDFVERHPSFYNVIVAADVLCYFGDLKAFTIGASRALRPGGYLAFTVEQLPANEAPFKLNSHGRYSHSEEYVRAVVADAGLSVASLKPDTLRFESRMPVAALVVLLHKPVTCCDTVGVE